MNRTFAIAVGVAAVLAASVALADDTPATSSTPPATSSAPAATKAPATTSAHHSSSKSAHHHNMVNLNTASKEQLVKLPGVTAETAEKIIASRPYTSTNELVSKKVVSEAEYKKMQGHVTAKHS